MMSTRLWQVTKIVLISLHVIIIALLDLLLGSLVHETPVMNTDIRRQIYCILMSAEDFSDAAEKLVKRGTKNQTEQRTMTPGPGPVL